MKATNCWFANFSLGVIEMDTNEQPVRLLMTADQAAAALAISPRKLWDLTQSGEIPSLRIGRSVRYDPDDLRSWIVKRKGGQQ